jgi:hypothetical protein
MRKAFDDDIVNKIVGDAAAFCHHMVRSGADGAANKG